MSWGRLLLVGLFFSLPAFAQDQFLISTRGANAQAVPDFRRPPMAAASEPWRILPKADSDKDSIAIASDTEGRGVVVTPGGPLPADTTCFAIRSYVVARDSKDSDSVHLVRYTTCVPAAKYRLKTTDARVVLTR